VPLVIVVRLAGRLHKRICAGAGIAGAEDVALAGWKAAAVGELARNIWVSFWRASVGFVIGGGIALPSAVNGLSQAHSKLTDTTLQMVRNIAPRVDPLVILWFGIDIGKLFLVRSFGVSSDLSSTRRRQSDAATDDKADAGAPEADPDVARQLTRQQQLPAASATSLGAGNTRAGTNPLMQATCQTTTMTSGTIHWIRPSARGKSQAADTRKAFDQAHDCEAFTNGRCSLAMVSPTAVLTRSGVTLSDWLQRQQRKHSSAKR